MPGPSDQQLRSWWEENPFLSGVNWTSGIEVGIRLISFVWIRRLLDGWPGVSALFEENELAVAQVAWHQEYLSEVPQPWIVGEQPRDRGGRRSAGGELRLSLVRRQRAVARRVGGTAGARAGAEHVPERAQPRAGERLPRVRGRARARRPRSRPTHPGIRSRPPRGSCSPGCSTPKPRCSTRRCSPPRQGDSDDGRALGLDAPGVIAAADRFSQPGQRSSGPAPWWPEVDHGVTSTVLGSLSRRPFAGRAGQAGCPTVPFPRRRADAAAERPDDGARDLVPLRRRPARVPVHRRATPMPTPSRSRSATVASRSWWTRAPTATTANPSSGGTSGRRSGTTRSSSRPRPVRLGRAVPVAPPCQDERGRGGPGPIRCGEERGRRSTTATESLEPPARHRRSVSLDAAARKIDIARPHRDVRSACHQVGLPPRARGRVPARRRTWRGSRGAPRPTARCGRPSVELAKAFRGPSHRGETSPVLGWYSSSFGSLEPTTVIDGRRSLLSRGAPRFTRPSRLPSRPERLQKCQGSVVK